MAARPRLHRAAPPRVPQCVLQAARRQLLPRLVLRHPHLPHACALELPGGNPVDQPGAHVAVAVAAPSAAMVWAAGMAYAFTCPQLVLPASLPACRCTGLWGSAQACASSCSGEQLTLFPKGTAGHTVSGFGLHLMPPVAPAGQAATLPHQHMVRGSLPGGWDVGRSGHGAAGMHGQPAGGGIPQPSAFCRPPPCACSS